MRSPCKSLSPNSKPHLLFQSRCLINFHNKARGIVANPPFYRTQAVLKATDHSEPDSEAFARPNPFAPPVEDPRDRTHGQGDESQQRVSPPEAERLVHLPPGQG